MPVKVRKERVEVRPHSKAPVESLIEAAFARIRQLGGAEEASSLFPNGLSSLELDLDSGDGAKISLKFMAPAAGSVPGAASVDDDLHILLDGDVVATFNADGHRIIALIAQKDLIHRFPNTMKKVQKVLDDGSRDLLTAAVFPDVIRSSHPETKPFHFVDIPLQDDGPLNPPLPEPPHVISKIAEFTASLKHGGTAQVMVDALSWVIHLVGDIHQPLHCVTHITSRHPAPEGDRGGNSFKLKGSPNNLHAVWDSSVSFVHNPNEDALAEAIIQEHSRQVLAADLQIADVEKWARGTFHLAKQFAYGPLHENPAAPPKLTAAYLKQAEKIGRKQAALAGYRLADRLHEIFG
jgi:S1/P1 Nuclease